MQCTAGPVAASRLSRTCPGAGSTLTARSGAHRHTIRGIRGNGLAARVNTLHFTHRPTTVDMRERKLQRLFLDYRDNGRADDLAAVFDEVAPGLHALARHVLGSVQDADDVLQATFLTAIERRERFDDSHPVRSWLAGILVNKARQHVRREARSPRPEDVSARAQSDPAAAASESELERRLDAALAGLPGRDREVLVAVLRDGEPPSEIARRDGVSAGTARVRVHRALRRLRRALPVGFATSAASGAPTLDAVRARVIQAARSHEPTAGGAAAAQGAASGAPALALAAAAVVTVGGVAAWTLRDVEPVSGSARNDATVARSSPTSPPAVPDLERSDVRTGRARSNAVAEKEETAIESTALSLTLRVTGLGEAPPPPEVVLEVRRDDAAPFSLELEEDGVRTMSLPGVTEESPLVVVVAHPGYVDVRRELGPDDRVEDGWDIAIDLVRSHTRLHGSVRFVGAGAQDASGAAALFPAVIEGTGYTRAVSTAAVEHEEEFVLWSEATEGRVVVAAAGFAPELRAFGLDSIGEVELGVFTLVRGAAIEGTAYRNREDDGDDAPPGEVTAHHVERGDASYARFAGTEVGLIGGRSFTSAVDVEVDAEGHFRIEGLEPAPHDVMYFQGFASTASSTHDVEAAGTRVDAPAVGVELVSPVHTYTVVVTSDGEPVRDATVHYKFDGGGSVSGPTVENGEYDFRMASSDPTSHEVVVSKPGFESRALRLAPADFGPTRRIAVDLARTAPPSELTLELVSPGGPLGPLHLRLDLAGSDFHVFRALDGTESLVPLGEVPAGSYELSIAPRIAKDVHPRQLGRWLATEARVELHPDQPVYLPVELVPAGRLLMHVTGAPGKTAGYWRLDGPTRRGLNLLRWDEEAGRSTEIWVTAEAEVPGDYWCHGALVPGDYELTVPRGEGSEPFVAEFAIVEGQVVEVDVDAGGDG